MIPLAERYRDRLPVDRRHAGRVARRGLDAAPPRPAPLRAARHRALAQVGGLEPDRELQGPRHDRGGVEGASRRARRRSCARRPGTPQPRRPRMPRGPGSPRSSSSPPGRSRAARSRRPRPPGRGCSRCRARSRRRSTPPGSWDGAATHALVNSLNPYRLEGQKTAAFEIVEELGGAPDVLALPYGGGGNTRAYALGFDESGAGLPPFLAGEATERAFTMATAIRIAEPAHARRRRRRSPARAGRSSGSPTRRSWPPGAIWHSSRASSASPPRPRASPRWRASGRSRAPASSASSRATASRTRRPRRASPPRRSRCRRTRTPSRRPRA